MLRPREQFTFMRCRLWTDGCKERGEFGHLRLASWYQQDGHPISLHSGTTTATRVSINQIDSHCRARAAVMIEGRLWKNRLKLRRNKEERKMMELFREWKCSR